MSQPEPTLHQPDRESTGDGGPVPHIPQQPSAYDATVVESNLSADATVTSEASPAEAFGYQSPVTPQYSPYPSTPSTEAPGVPTFPVTPHQPAATAPVAVESAATELISDQPTPAGATPPAQYQAPAPPGYEPVTYQAPQSPGYEAAPPVAYQAPQPAETPAAPAYQTTPQQVAYQPAAPAYQSPVTPQYGAYPAAPASAIPASAQPASAQPASAQPAPAQPPAGYPAPAYATPVPPSFGAPAAGPYGATPANPYGPALPAAPAPKKPGRAALIVTSVLAAVFLLAAVGLTFAYLGAQNDLSKQKQTVASQKNQINDLTTKNNDTSTQLSNLKTSTDNQMKQLQSDKAAMAKCVDDVDVLLNLPVGASDATVRKDWNKMASDCEVAKALSD